MKFGNVEISPIKFYTIGVWCFGIGALMNTVTFAVTMHNLIPTQVISQISSLVFSYILFGLFNYLRNQVPPEIKPEDVMKELDIEKELKKHGK